MDRLNTTLNTTIDSSITSSALQLTIKQTVAILSLSIGTGPHQISSAIFVKSEDKDKPDTPLQRATNIKKVFLPLLREAFGDNFYPAALSKLLDEIDDKLHPTDGKEFTDLFDFFVARTKSASTPADRFSQASFRAWVINGALKVDLNDPKISEHLRAKQEKINKSIQDQLLVAVAAAAAAEIANTNNGDVAHITGFKRQRDPDFDNTIAAYLLTRPLEIPPDEYEFCRNVAKGEVCGKHTKGLCWDDHEERPWHTPEYKAWLAAFPRFVPPNNAL